jgi:hypothetical protein
MSAYIFLCNEQTEKECYERQLFGTNYVDYFTKYFSKIKVGDDLFLFNFEIGNLQGPFKALTSCVNKIDQAAFSKKYPYQVKVQSFAYEKGLLAHEVRSVINFIDKPPAQIEDSISEKLKAALKQKNAGAGIEIDDSKVSNYWIFKCDKTTGGRVFSDNLVGAPSTAFTNYINKVQIGDIIFVWQIEERKLYGLWKARERGRYDEFAFPETRGKYNSVIQCDRTFKLQIGIGENVLKNQLQVFFSKNNMPGYNLNPIIGRHIQEELFKANDSITVTVPENTIAGNFLTEDGHWVRSQGETLIDNWLYRNNVLHGYEHRIQKGTKFKKSDFYLPQYDLVIEYWGMSGNQAYEISKKDKINFYNENKINFLELFPQDIQMLSEVLKSKLAAYGIDVI